MRTSLYAAFAILLLAANVLAAPASPKKVSTVPQPTAWLEIVDVDCPPTLVSAASAAINKWMGDTPGLAALGKDAAKHHRFFNYIRGVTITGPLGVKSTSSANFAVFGSTPSRPSRKVGTPRLLYKLRQTVTMTPRLGSVNGLALTIAVDERRTIPVRSHTGPMGHWNGLSMTGNFVFHDGETQVLSEVTTGGGVNHIVYGTVFLIPTSGPSHGKTGRRSQ